MARMEEKGGEDWTDEKKAEYEKRVTGKILAAAWRGSKYEIQDVLREVCDRVLNDKTVKLEKRVERAQAMVLIGEIFAKVWLHYLTIPRLNFWFGRTWRIIQANAQRRQQEIPTKKATTWPSSSSWPRPHRRKTENRRRRRRKRKKRRRRSRTSTLITSPHLARRPSRRNTLVCKTHTLARRPHLR